ncbi:MAG TPA: hypothetical protein VFX86_02675 [Candidatus Saccharimonadales bacterium]|nr:hypothetical protein [Candidatus Saccharimonadales bacterium]
MVYSFQQGLIRKGINRFGLFFVALALAIAASLAISSTASAGHNGADISHQTGTCGETTFSAGIIDPDGTHKVGNMYLVVSAEGDTQFVNVPTDGSVATITTGPFYGSGDDVTISWNVFGGAERSYDQPLWNGYGTPTFSSDINAYATSQGGFGWVLDGPDEPNPFVNWNEFNVESCEITKDFCKKGGYAAFGFRNQGLCIQYANTGKDSR